MAGAFVAVADDATAAYWNPAGLPTGAFLSLLADNTASRSWHDASRPDSPGTDGMGTFVGLSTNTTGLSYYRLRINQIERFLPPGASADFAQQDQWGEATLRSVVTHNLALTTAQLLYPGVSLGSTLRYVRGSFGVDSGRAGLTTDEWLRDARDIEGRSQNKVDLDVGLKVGGDRFQAAIVARNLLQPTLEAPDGGSVRLDRQVRAGIAVRAVGALLLAGDIDLSRSATAHGFRREQPVGAVGVSLALSEGIYVDAQVSRGRDQVEQAWSLAARFGF
jgi:hypothetical protein